ncbi:MAG: Ycf66 family protein [Cyanobacteria bacterium P01_D01_bin.156]
MLANLLAIVVGLGSLGFYLVAFILPEVHRRSDFFWSGVGMFYAVVLWSCARQMQGAVLLGQTASVGLVLWLGYQTLLLRRETTPTAQQTPIRLGKGERSRTASRPIAKDYEFVEDGVEDAIEEEEDPDAPVLIKSTADEFAPKIVVPAAILQTTAKTGSTQENIPDSPPVLETSTPPKSAKKHERPNPVAAVGILVNWIKEVATPNKKEPQPMIELPPRPPSIPKKEQITETITPKDNEPSSLEDKPLSTTEAGNTPSALLTDKESYKGSEADNSHTGPDAVSPTVTKPTEQEEDSNWPDDEFWE